MSYLDGVAAGATIFVLLLLEELVKYTWYRIQLRRRVRRWILDIFARDHGDCHGAKIGGNPERACVACLWGWPLPRKEGLEELSPYAYLARVQRERPDLHPRIEAHLKHGDYLP